jgi:PAS domain S-box-containing protein
MPKPGETSASKPIPLSKRKNTEKLERSQLLARSILDHATAAVVITGRDGRIAHANSAAESLAGRELTDAEPNPSTLVSERFLDAFPLRIETSGSSGVPESAAALLVSALSGSVYRGLQACIQSRTGGVVDLLLSAGPFRPSAGDTQGAVFTFSEVSALREAQRSLRQSEQRFRDLAESIPQLVWTTNAEGRLDYCNTRMIEYFGKTFEDLVREPFDLIHPDDAAESRLAWLGALETKSLFEIECRMLSKDGSYHWFLNRALPIRGAEGKIAHWFGTCTNVDAQKHVEKELRRANADLEQFAYAAGHDFQEPLRAVTVYSQLLERSRASGSDADVPLFLRYIVEGAERLGALVQNLLAYMQANRDHETIPGEIDCEEVLREVLAGLRLGIEESGAQIIAESLPKLRFAHVHMVQLFQNLITNAIKYRGAEPPRIVIAAEKRGVDWLFSVQDNGIGIAPEHQHTIFGVFKRLHGGDIPGTGIGLAICQRLLDQYGGKIWVESEPDKGSTFYFLIPAAVAEKAYGSSS